MGYAADFWDEDDDTADDKSTDDGGLHILQDSPPVKIYFLIARGGAEMHVVTPVQADKPCRRMHLSKQTVFGGRKAL